MIESQRTLLDFTIGDFPHMKKPDRQKLHRSVHKNAYLKEESEFVSTEQLNEKLKRILRG